MLAGGRWEIGSQHTTPSMLCKRQQEAAREEALAIAETAIDQLEVQIGCLVDDIFALVKREARADGGNQDGDKAQRLLNRPASHFPDEAITREEWCVAAERHPEMASMVGIEGLMDVVVGPLNR